MCCFPQLEEDLYVGNSADPFSNGRPGVLRRARRTFCALRTTLKIRILHLFSITSLSRDKISVLKTEISGPFSTLWYIIPQFLTSKKPSSVYRFYMIQYFFISMQ